MGLLVIAEGTTTTDGTEQTLVTDTSNHVYVFKIDLTTMVNGDILEVRIKDIVRSAGAEGEGFIVTYANAQEEVIKYSDPVPADISFKVTIKRVGGADHAYPWKVIGLA